MFTLEKKSYYYHYYYHFFLVISIYNFNIISEIVLPYKQAYSSNQKLFLITFLSENWNAIPPQIIKP